MYRSHFYSAKNMNYRLDHVRKESKHCISRSQMSTRLIPTMLRDTLSNPSLAHAQYSGRVHSIRIPPHRIILSGCLLSFSDYTASHFRYLGDGHQGHPVIDYRYRGCFAATSI